MMTCLKNQIRSFCFLVIFLFGGTLAGHALEGPYDHSLWDQFLKKHVNEDGQMDFESAKADPDLLNRYLEQINKISYHELLEWPREEKLALWLNAYHAGLIQIIINHYPLKSIQDIPGGWETSFVHISSKSYSLNEIRSKQLIGSFHDEKIHAALACGAESCPKFTREAFTGPKVEGQLYLAAREFVNNVKHVNVVPEKKRIWVSRIFKWYGNDFKLDFGMPQTESGFSVEESAILSFIAYYLEDSTKIAFLEERQYKIKYLPFDWKLKEWHKSAG